MDQSVTTALPSLTSETPEDVRLIDRYLAGDVTAFDEIMVRHQRQIYRLCYRYVEDRDIAMDLAQDVFVKAFEHLSTFRRESSLKTWLYRIATNHCLNHVKKRTPEFVEVEDSHGHAEPRSHRILEDRENRETLRRLVRDLPPKQKAILELRINEELSYDEIAKISGRSVSTIKASVFFALSKLKKRAGAAAESK